MIKREFLINLKSLVIWSIVLGAFLTMLFWMFPYLMTEESIVTMEAMIKAFPEEMIKAFNLDIDTFTTPLGFMKTKGMILVILAYGFYAALLGSTILLKEESDKTIEYLYSKPVTKNKIVGTKLICGLINIVLFNFIISIVMVVGFLQISDSYKEILILNLSALMPSIVMFLIAMLLSTFFSKEKKVLPLSLGIVLVSYFLTTFASISDKIEFLKYGSFYSLIDLTSNTNGFVFNNLIITIIISIALIFLIFKNYNNKEYC